MFPCPSFEATGFLCGLKLCLYKFWHVWLHLFASLRIPALQGKRNPFTCTNAALPHLPQVKVIHGNSFLSTSERKMEEQNMKLLEDGENVGMDSVAAV